LVFGCYQICARLGYAIAVAQLSMTWASSRSISPDA